MKQAKSEWENKIRKWLVPGLSIFGFIVIIVIMLTMGGSFVNDVYKPAQNLEKEQTKQLQIMREIEQNIQRIQPKDVQPPEPDQQNITDGGGG